MSRIGGPGDRPIATNEPTTEAQQTSETESIQKTDVQGKAPFDAEETANYHTPSTDTKSQQHESRLGGLARQAELQSLLPKHSEPVLKDLPGRPNLDPNVHLDEKIDVTKNLPDGHAINSGLEGLDWGSSKAKTGPNHMGVDVTYGGMKAPADRIAEVLNAGKLGQPNSSSSPKGGGSIVSSSDKSVEGGGIKSNPSDGPGSKATTEGKGGPSSLSEGKGSSAPPPGAELSFRAPKWGQLSQEAKPAEKTAGEKFDEAVESIKKVGSDVVDLAVDVIMTLKGPPLGGEGVGLIRGPQLVKDVTGDAADLLRGVQGATTGGNQVKKAKDLLVDPKGMVDPDAGGNDVSAEDIARKVKVHSGSVEHGVNPDLGVGPVTYGELKHPIDLLSDPIDDGESSVETSSLEKAKLAADIHGPRTVNPDSGFGGVKPGGVKSGGDPSVRDDINKP